MTFAFMGVRTRPTASCDAVLLHGCAPHDGHNAHDGDAHGGQDRHGGPSRRQPARPPLPTSPSSTGPVGDSVRLSTVSGSSEA